MYPKPIQNLINLFTKLPGIGPKQASRFVFYLLKEDQNNVNKLADSIKMLKEAVKFCGQCFKSVEVGSRINTNLTANDTNASANDTNILCEFCKDEKRDKKIILVVEKESELQNIEKTKKYNGLYHVLGGIVSPLDSSAPAKLHLKDLFERIKKLSADGQKVEVILATNPTTEGDTTALYIERILRPLEVKISRLGRGLGTGSELEYADEITISNALVNRK